MFEYELVYNKDCDGYKTVDHFGSAEDLVKFVRSNKLTVKKQSANGKTIEVSETKKEALEFFQLGE